MAHWDNVIPESVRLDLNFYREDERPQHRLPDGSTIPGGESLADFVERIGGWSGTLVDPWGNEHSVSVESWADEDPERTYVQFAYRGRLQDRPKADPEQWARLKHTRVDRMELHAINVGDPYWGVPSDEDDLPGCSLREMRERLGGDEGFLTDDEGRQHRVSLRQWRTADPDRTRIVVKQMHEPEHFREGDAP
jgi:hypothetical protein